MQFGGPGLVATPTDGTCLIDFFNPVGQKMRCKKWQQNGHYKVVLNLGGGVHLIKSAKLYM